MRVIVARHDVVPVEISHPHLFVPKPKPAEVPLALEQPAENPARPIKTAANATLRATDAVQIAGTDEASDAPKPEDPLAAAKPAPRKAGTVSVFISRKEGKLFVRHGFEPLFDAPVTIESPESPLGTHVFTALGLKDGGAEMRWNVVSLSGERGGSFVRIRFIVSTADSAWNARRPVSASKRIVPSEKMSDR